MDLILIHGAPVTGKTTVAKALSRLTALPAVDNILAIDLARQVFPNGDGGFWPLVHELRLTTLRAAVRAGMPRLIMTAAYSHPDDLPLYEDYERVVQEGGGRVVPVYLSCSEATLMERVVSEDRRRRGKLSTVERLRGHLARNSFAALPREGC
ncbi:AAA family ATPase [Amaricoccus tamworthensis]|uniref:AAA family ATPase n=1 Tax=Amaricoccus tamworthensis TaxID=57002 RepID=UPI003C7D1738